MRDATPLSVQLIVLITAVTIVLPPYIDANSNGAHESMKPKQQLLPSSDVADEALEEVPAFEEPESAPERALKTPRQRTGPDHDKIRAALESDELRNVFDLTLAAHTCALVLGSVIPDQDAIRACEIGVPELATQVFGAMPSWMDLYELLRRLRIHKAFGDDDSNKKPLDDALRKMTATTYRRCTIEEFYDLVACVIELAVKSPQEMVPPGWEDGLVKTYAKKRGTRVVMRNTVEPLLYRTHWMRELRNRWRAWDASSGSALD